MGLDVYVGSLTRYYLGEWETIVQQAAREQRIAVEVRRLPATPRSMIGRMIDRITQFRRTGPEAAARDVERWRQALGRASGLRDSFRWNENLEYEYFTDKPAWDGYGALVLWACYEQLPDAPRAETAAAWSDDPAYRAAMSLPDQRYRHLVADTGIWFPLEFDEPFGITSLAGQPMVAGSSIQLLRELEQLNAKTWRATDDAIGQWRIEGAEYGAPLEQSAQFGFSIFHELAKLSVQHKLPMKLDY